MASMRNKKVKILEDGLNATSNKSWKMVLGLCVDNCIMKGVPDVSLPLSEAFSGVLKV